MKLDKSYDWVENYFFENGWACAECQWCKTYRDWSEFWGRRVAEETNECTLLNDGRTDKCPALQEKENTNAS